MFTVPKISQRLYFPKRLKSFNACPKLLELFYRHVLSGVSGDIQQRLTLHQKRDKARLSKVTNTAKVTSTASRLIGRPVPDLQTHFEAKAAKRLEAIQCDPLISHAM